MFIVTNQNTAGNEYFCFTVKQLFIGKGINRFYLSLVKKRQKNKIFKNNNFILLPNILSHIFNTFSKKKINIR